MKGIRAVMEFQNKIWQLVGRQFYWKSFRSNHVHSYSILKGLTNENRSRIYIDYQD